MNKKFVQELLVDEKSSLSRLDFFLAKKLNITRSKAQSLVKSGLITVSGEKATPKRELRPGELVTIREKFVRPDLVLTPVLLYEDDDILVVDKPAGMNVHPAPSEKDPTLTEFFKDKYMDDATEDENPMVVHRLDKGTSGVILMAKNSFSKANLQAQFKTRKVAKIYLALTEGIIESEKGTITMPISRDESNRARMGVAAGGKEAETKFKVLERFDRATYVEVVPKTGRTHQIRVHFMAIGHPLVGDKRYGAIKFKTPRIFLHATSITFCHPRNNETLTFSSPLPAVLIDQLESLRV